MLDKVRIMDTQAVSQRGSQKTYRRTRESLSARSSRSTTLMLPTRNVGTVLRQGWCSRHTWRLWISSSTTTGLRHGSPSMAAGKWIPCDTQLPHCVQAHLSDMAGLTRLRDRTDPAGYKLSTVEFANGAPVAPSTSNTSYTDILANEDNSKCPAACFRPVGLAWDSSGNLFMSSDSTGEIYLIRRADGSPTNSSLPSTVTSGSQTPTPSGGVSSSSSSAVAARITPAVLGLWHWVDALAYGRM